MWKTFYCYTSFSPGFIITFSCNTRFLAAQTPEDANKRDISNLFHLLVVVLNKAFINYNFLFTGFCARKTILRACLCTWEIVQVKEGTDTLLLITWFGSRNCAKSVFKSLAAKKSLSIRVLCTVPFF